MSISLSCPINNTGYGLSSFNILKELYKLDQEISFFPIGDVIINSIDDKNLLSYLYSKSFELDIDAPYIKIWHQFDLANHIGRGKYYAYPFFELDTFNQLEIKHLNVPDGLFVTSSWAKTIIEQNNVKTSCVIVPLGVDTKIFDYNKYHKLNNSSYIFLHIGKWEVRKGHDFILDFFNLAFPNEKDVELWILASETTNKYSTPEQIAQWRSKYSDPRVKIFSGAETQHDIAQLIAQSDCGLYPSRAEGWNLELLETMAMNKPVIATNYSAHTEFCSTDNSYLVDIDQIEPAYDGKAFRNQGNWAKIGEKQKDQIIEYMRYLYQNRISTNKNGILTAEKYSWTNSANIINRCIKNL